MQLRVRDDVTTSAPIPRHRLDWDPDPELSRFPGLTDEEKVRVIIRVLCGLVALEETDPSDAGPRLVVEPPAQPAPRPPRLLPFLGYESPGPPVRAAISSADAGLSAALVASAGPAPHHDRVGA